VSVIIDANCARAALQVNAAGDFAPVLEAILNGTAKLVVGGKLKREYQVVQAAWRFVMRLDQAGMARLVNDATVDQEEEAVLANFKLRSDDPHILALARVSKARLLCSLDKELHADFDDPKIINNPRGFIYQSPKHKKLIRKCCG
jgi:predicted nucleic acid-binding protein